VDGSPLGEAVIAFAFEVAAGRNAPVVAVHAWGDFVVQDGFGFGALAVDWDEVDREEHRVLDERLATWVEKYPEVQVERIVARDTPSRLLLRSAEGASLVVLGTRRRGGLSGLLLGSTSHALLHHSSCPVAVIPSIPVD
jgi:nucleotide-binding universal stress UspA family protein